MVHFFFFENWDSFLMVMVVFDFVVFWRKTRVNEVHMFQPVFFNWVFLMTPVFIFSGVFDGE